MRITDLDTPVLVVDIDVLERNLRRAADYAREHRLALRPHTKTHKMLEIARRQVELSGAGLTVAKLGEAEVFADAGLDDLFIAYPLVGEAKLRRLAALCERASVRVACDSHEVAEGLSRAMSAAGQSVGVLVETDTGYGRCGVPVGPELVALCRRAQELPGLDFLGVMTYQGHTGGPPAQREEKIIAERDRLRRMRDTLDEAAVSCRVVSGGTTPSLYLLHHLDVLTEIRPGTYVFNDRNTLLAGACEMKDIAARFIATVVSTAVPGKAIIDAGSKTLFSDRTPTADGYGFVVEDPEVIVTMMNEEHGYLDLTRATRKWHVGDRVTIVPNHICAAVNLHDEVVVHRAGEVLDTWRVAGRGKVR